MNIIICGAGRVGEGIAAALARDSGRTVTVIDEDPARIERLQVELDIRGFVGHASHPDVLKRAGADDADMIIAVTHSDEVNMLICLLAERIFGIMERVARVRSRSYTDEYRATLFNDSAIPANKVISPERTTADAIITRLRNPGAIVTDRFANGHVALLGVEIMPGSPAENNKPAGVFEAIGVKKAHPMALWRGGRMYGRDAQPALQAGDRLYIAAERGLESRILSAFQVEDTPARQVLLLGAGNIGLEVARGLEQVSGLKVRLIEADRERANASVSDIKRSLLLHGDALDVSMLEQADAGASDFVVGVTNDDRTNLLACGLAKQLGARRTMALVNQPDLAKLRDALSIDMIVDPRSLTASAILQRLRKGRINRLRSIEQGRAEIVEFEYFGTTSSRMSAYADLPGASHVAFGAVVRGSKDGGTVIWPNNLGQPQKGDLVVAMYETRHVSKVKPLVANKPPTS